MADPDRPPRFRSGSESSGSEGWGSEGSGSEGRRGRLGSGAAQGTGGAPAVAAPPAATAAYALEVSGLTVSYSHKPVLRGVSLAVPSGQLVAIVGPNGAGKSTLLKAVLGLVRPDAGTIRCLGRSLAAARQQIAYVPQTDSTDWDFPVTVREVAMMGRYGALGLVGRPRQRDRELVDRALATVGMADFAARHIRQLSGGQQQRVFLARALAQEARLLLLDEPFAGVDARTEEAIFRLMDRFSAAGRTMLVVNHNLQILDRFAAVCMLNQTVIAYGPPRDVVNTETLRRAYGGRMSFVDEAERSIQEGPPDVR
ncbi:MAG: metal ABC transporter ATP-binding protein [Planctomycetota bacterium]